MTTTPRTNRDERQIRAMIEDRVRAVRAKDVEALVAVCTPLVVVFDALPPLVRTGVDALRDRLEEWFGWYDGPIAYEVRDVQITTAGGAAFAHFLYRVTGTMKDGAQVDMWLRTTIGLEKIDAAWMIAHEHVSVPFDTESGQAALDLTP